MSLKDYFRQPMSLSDRMVIAKTLVGIVIAIFLIAFSIFCSIFGWP